MSIDLNSYKNIIFDLGGVILNIDYERTSDALRTLGLQDAEDAFSKSSQAKVFDDYEKGLITSDMFHFELKKHLVSGVHTSEIDNAWNAMLLDLPEERLTLIKKIKKSHSTFLLSNTNEIHMNTINSYLLKTFHINDLSGYFEKLYLSYKINMRKPDAEIFEFVLHENGLMAAETLFIDDSPQHIEGAKKLGIQTYWLDVKKESIIDLFN